MRLRLRGLESILRIIIVCCPFHVELKALFIEKSSWKDRIAEL